MPIDLAPQQTCFHLPGNEIRIRSGVRLLKEVDELNRFEIVLVDQLEQRVIFDEDARQFRCTDYLGKILAGTLVIQPDYCPTQPHDGLVGDFPLVRGTGENPDTVAAGDPLQSE